MKINVSAIRKRNFTELSRNPTWANMVTCSAMDNVVIPRPPAPPLDPLLSSNRPFRGPPLPPAPPPPSKPIDGEVRQSSTTTSMCQVTRDLETGDKKVHEERTVLEERQIVQKMVDKKISRNESVRSKMSSRSVTSQKSNGFRLIENPSMNGSPHAHNFSNNDDTGSIYSIYKQKIDSMFESDSSSGTNHNIVQAKIEKMFSDIAQDSNIPTNQIGVHTFSIDYLGSVALQEKVTSLAGLQKPLKELYFSYKKIAKSKKPLTGRLEISCDGLRVQYQGAAGDLEQMNSFPTIAVWSAVKFVIQENSSMLHGLGVSFAFLPLITDPDNMDKQSLFKSLSEAEKKFILNEQHSPLFAVVMRKIGVQKQLECHGFVCQTSEDAIVIAATLYKALVNHMKNKERRPTNKNGLTTCTSTTSSTILEKSGSSLPIRPPRRKRSSVASSVCSDTNSVANVSDTQPLLSSKPLKKSIKAKKAPKAPEPSHSEDLDAIIPYEEPIRLISSGNNTAEKTGDEDNVEVKPKSFSDKLSTYMSKEQKEIAAEIKQVVSNSKKGLKRVQSIRKRDEENVCKKEHSGDILTKVTIPRSGSFLNTGGLTRYKNKGSRNDQTPGGGSPLGLKEIFHELSLQEGLHSMDDILSVIIDPDGMSFNDLKPIYKEFLLKLAVTFTKDELYLKSKSIMRRQRKRSIRRSSSVPLKKSANKLVSNKFKRLKHIFQKNLNPNLAKMEKTGKNFRDIKPELKRRVESKFPESSISTSSYDTKPFRTKEELVGKRTSYRKKTHGDINRNRHRERTSTSEESDFFSLKRQCKFNKYQNILTANQNRNSSSGYVSCSECSYDSDTCTCVSADKCYCSLGERNCGTSKKDLTYCDCDTDSCAESNKCYCQYGVQRRSSFRRPAHNHLARCGKNVNDRRQHLHKKLCKNNSNTKSSRSLEYMSNPSEGYYEKLRSKQKYGSERLQSPYASSQICSMKKRRNSHTGVNLTDADFSMMTLENFQIHRGKLSAMDYELLKLSRRAGEMDDLAGLKEAIRRGGLGENSKEYWGTTRGIGAKEPGVQKIQSAITTGACTEALSVKKSAEIAALFSDMKLSQTTDITHLTSANFDIDPRNIYNLEKSLQAKYSKPNKGSSSRASDPVHKPSLPTSHYGRPNMTKSKSKMYSAKNGLYTIQSQSDESKHSGSRRSSINGDVRKLAGEVEKFGNRRNLSSNIENSLGYLP
ncbi:uncharacterized protein [Euwallacea fornicatus]|uniref:uncharacterized protein isoform X4 n=1 Tax=Euwallacea fornicatus TaxID=995702 RepID=UPI0033901C08